MSWLGAVRLHKHTCLSKGSQQYSEEHFAVCKFYLNLRRLLWMSSQILKKSLDLGGRKTGKNHVLLPMV